MSGDTGFPRAQRPFIVAARKHPIVEIADAKQRFASHDQVCGDAGSFPCLLLLWESHVEVIEVCPFAATFLRKKSRQGPVTRTSGSCRSTARALCNQPVSGTQSLSVNARKRPVARSMAAFRAAYDPGCETCIIRALSGKSGGGSRGSGSLFTIMISKRSIGTDCRDRAAKHCPSRAQSRVHGDYDGKIDHRCCNRPHGEKKTMKRPAEGAVRRVD